MPTPVSSGDRESIANLMLLVSDKSSNCAEKPRSDPWLICRCREAWWRALLLELEFAAAALLMPAEAEEPSTTLVASFMRYCLMRSHEQPLCFSNSPFKYSSSFRSPATCLFRFFDAVCTSRAVSSRFCVHCFFLRRHLLAAIRFRSRNFWRLASLTESSSTPVLLDLRFVPPRLFVRVRGRPTAPELPRLLVLLPASADVWLFLEEEWVVSVMIVYSSLKQSSSSSSSSNMPPPCGLGVNGAGSSGGVIWPCADRVSVEQFTSMLCNGDMVGSISTGGMNLSVGDLDRGE